MTFKQIKYNPIIRTEKYLIIMPPGSGRHFICNKLREYLSPPYLLEEHPTDTGSDFNDWNFNSAEDIQAEHMEGFFPYYYNSHQRQVTKSVYNHLLNEIRDLRVMVVYGGEHSNYLDCLAKYKRNTRGSTHYSKNGAAYVDKCKANEYINQLEDIKHNQHYLFFIRQLDRHNIKHIKMSYQELFYDMNFGDKFLELFGDPLNKLKQDILKYNLDNRKLME